MKEMQQLKKEHYGKNTYMLCEGGTIDFNPDSMAEVVGGEKLRYNEYLDIQFASLGKIRNCFAQCHVHSGLSYQGKIEKKTSRRVCFRDIAITGMFPDGVIFEGKEDHVWMDKTGFEQYQVGDFLSFSAQTYRYLKTSNQKKIDFALCNPTEIQKIPSYALPTDAQLFAQSLQEITCECCLFADHCDGVFCLRG